MSECTHPAPAKTMAQVLDQYRVVVHLAKSLALVFEQSADFYAKTANNLMMIDMLGEHSAAIMEMLGDILNGMDAVDDDEDGWTNQIFRIAHATWPRGGAQ